MDYAANVQGFPIYGEVPGAGLPAPRLYFDAANNRVVDPDGNQIQVDADGKPTLDDGTAIAQPTIARLVQIMVADGVGAHMRAGRLAAPVVPVGPVVANFGLMPATVNNNIIDYTTREGAGLYRDATKSLYQDGENDLAWTVKTSIHLSQEFSNELNHVGGTL